MHQADRAMCTLPPGVKCWKQKEEREVDRQRDRGLDIPYCPMKSSGSWCCCADEKHLFRAGPLGWKKRRVSAHHVPRQKRECKVRPEIIHKEGKFLAGHDHAETRLPSFRCTQNWEVTLNSFPQPFCQNVKAWKYSCCIHPTLPSPLFQNISASHTSLFLLKLQQVFSSLIHQ